MESNGKEISSELMDKAAKCRTAEELLALAKENGIELTPEQAEAYLSAYQKGEITDEEMAAVAGGTHQRLHGGHNHLLAQQKQPSDEAYHRPQ